MKKFFLLFIFCLLMCGCKEKIYTEIPKTVTIRAKSTVEVYSNIYLKDIVTITNGEMVSDNILINTNKTGIIKQEIYYKVDKKKYVYKFDVNIVDKEAPRIFSGVNKTVELNHTGDLCNLIMFGDNYDKKALCTIKGSYDISKVGSYPLEYTVTDSSNNYSTFNITLNVVKKINNSSSTSTEKLYFQDVINKYKTVDNEIGIDVSRWQTSIDFNKVKEAGATFAMMRIGVQKVANGELEIDSYYLKNIENAKKAGLKVGVYLYSIATSAEESVKHANWVLEKLNGTKLDLPVVFDWESWSQWNNFNLSFYDINNIAEKFIDAINKGGYQGMLYSSKNYLENIWTNKNNHPVWLAHYTKETTYQGDYVMWQLSNIGRINGVSGAVDINILYNNK